MATVMLLSSGLQGPLRGVDLISELDPSLLCWYQLDMAMACNESLLIRPFMNTWWHTVLKPCIHLGADAQEISLSQRRACTMA